MTAENGVLWIVRSWARQSFTLCVETLHAVHAGSTQIQRMS